MLNNRKFKRTFGVIMVLIIPFLIGIVIGIILGKTVFAKKNDYSIPKNSIVEITDNTLKEKLLKVVDNNTLEKVIYKYRSNIIDFNELSNDEKLYLAGIDTYYKKSGSWVSFDTLKDNLNKSYGSSYNLKPNEYNYHDIAVIEYKDGNYEGSNVASYTDNQEYIDIYNVEKLISENDKYYLEVNGIYHQVLKDSEKFSNDKGFIFNEALESKTTVKELYQTNEEQFMQFIFTFQKKDNTYILLEFKKS